MNKKLSIIQRATDKTGWDKSNQFSGTDITNIQVTKARNDKALNAIPSPLARFHLFESAFELLDKDELKNTNEIGDTYKKIVSDCFDVFELFYNWNNHIRDNKKLSLILWDQDTQLAKLNNGKGKHKLLGETLEMFFNEDAFKEYKEILIIKLDGRVIAGSSPFTGFITTPDNLDKISLYNPLNKRNYFQKITSFKDRKPEIKKYIYDYFFSRESLLSSHTISVKNYLNKYIHQIDKEMELLLEPIDSFILKPKIKSLLSSTAKSETDYFEEFLVKVNYRLNNECYQVPKNDNESRSYDFLLPFTQIFYEDFLYSEIESITEIYEIDKGTVRVSVKKNGQSYEKLYQTNKVRLEDGQIIDLYNDYSIKFSIGIFPFIKAIENLHDNNNQSVPCIDFNDFYKVMLVCQDDNHLYSNKDFKLSFSIGNSLIEPPTSHNYLTSIDHRTILSKDQSQVGSTYYSIQGKEKINVCFDSIRLELPLLKKEHIFCTIVPKWREKYIGTKQIDYAIDFGTTTTFIAYTDDENRQSAPKPLSFEIDKANSVNEYIVAMLNKPKSKTTESTDIKSYETFSSFQEAIEIQKQEFIPSLINNEQYKIPFRTAVYQKNNIQDGKRKMFSNTNISFTYQKYDNNATSLDQIFISNLKWNVKTEQDQETIQIFVEELYYLLRLKTILIGGDPRKTKISWFSPLSFSPAEHRNYKQLWEKQFIRTFNAPSSNLYNISESEAPYYYYLKTGTINNKASVLTMDIGGGTTDIMYIRDKPVLSTSVQFGANLLWGNGFNELTKTARENGIYLTIKEKIKGRLNSTLLKQMNDSFNQINSEYSSDEIINFWIINDDESNVIKELNKGIFRLSYLLHFTALIYHSYEILYSKGQPAPTCIIFSGNGSKYLDLIESEKYIGKICEFVSNYIFKTANSVPQIILPSNNRKEATCYGGLYKPIISEQENKSVTFIGTESSGRVFTKYGELELHKELVLSSVKTSFSNFVECFFNMNEEQDLNFRTTFDIELNLSAVKEFMLSNTAENLETGYSKMIQKINNEDPITNSLFFYPLIGLLFKLNKLSAEDLNNYKPIIKCFAVSAEGSNGFISENLSYTLKKDSIFSIVIDKAYPEFGELSIIPESSVYKKALNSIEGYLKPVCNWDEYPTNSMQTIEVISKGKIQKEGNMWIVKEKIKIKFV